MIATVVLVHGIGGSYYEIETLKFALETKGFKVLTPILAGHETGNGQNRNRLKGVTEKDWLNSVRVACDEAFASSTEVYYIGFSMGGMLGALLASEYTFSGFITMNTPYHFWNVKQIVTNLTQGSLPKIKSHLEYYMCSGKKLPTSAMLSFYRALHASRKAWGHVTCPLLIIQTKDDDAVKPISAECIYNQSGSIEKHYDYIKTGGHLVLKSDSATEVCNKVVDWLIKVRSGASCD